MIALGLDIGTSGLRAALLDGDGREIGGASRPFAEHERRDPLAWRAALDEVLHEALDEVLDEALGAIDPSRVGAVAVDGTSGTLLGLDGGGGLAAGPLMYDDRTEDGDLVARNDALAPPASAARGAGSGALKALRLLGAPGVEQIAHQADWIVAALTGRADRTDESNALKTGYDPVAREWPPWLERLGIDRARLPLVVPVGTPLAPVSGSAARRYGLSPDAVVVGGLTDGCASFLATGASRPGEAATALGSTLTLKLLSDRPVFDGASGVYSHRIGGAWLAGGASNTGGAVLAEHYDADEIERLSARIDPGVDAGEFHPLLRPGERFPVADPALSPAMPDPAWPPERHLHALLEGIARIEAMGYARLVELGAPSPSRVLSVGGGARNGTWTAIRARRLRASLGAVAMGEALSTDAAVGAARVALAHLGGRPVIEARPGTGP